MAVSLPTVILSRRPNRNRLSGAWTLSQSKVTTSRHVCRLSKNSKVDHRAPRRPYEFLRFFYLIFSSNCQCSLFLASCPIYPPLPHLICDYDEDFCLLCSFVCSSHRAWSQCSSIWSDKREIRCSKRYTLGPSKQQSHQDLLRLRYLHLRCLEHADPERRYLWVYHS
jgi:hypothetical protein